MLNFGGFSVFLQQNKICFTENIVNHQLLMIGYPSMCPSDDWGSGNQLLIWINIRDTVASSRGKDFRETLLWAFKKPRLFGTKLSARKRRKLVLFKEFPSLPVARLVSADGGVTVIVGMSSHQAKYLSIYI